MLLERKGFRESTNSGNTEQVVSVNMRGCKTAFLKRTLRYSDTTSIQIV